MLDLQRKYAFIERILSLLVFVCIFSHLVVFALVNERGGGKVLQL